MNESLSEVDPLGRILFTGLWCQADRNGRLENRPKRIRAEVLPYDDVTVAQVEQWLQQLASKLLISFYQVGGNSYIQITNFTKHQSPHPDEKPIHPDPIAGDELKAEPEQNQPVIASNLPATSEQLTDNLPESYQQSSYSLTLTLSNSNSEESNQKENSTEPLSDSANPPVASKPLSPVEIVFDHWKQVCNHPKAILDAKRRRVIADRLKQFSLDDCKRAIDGCRASPWHQGANDRGKVFDDVDLIFRDAKHVEDFIRVLEQTPTTARGIVKTGSHHSVPKTAGNVAQMENWLNSRRASNG